MRACSVEDFRLESRGYIVPEAREICGKRNRIVREKRGVSTHHVPLLAIRNMVRTDAPFLTNDAISLSAYLARFGHDVPARLQAKVLDAARAHGLSFDSRSEEALRQEESRDQDPVI